MIMHINLYFQNTFFVLFINNIGFLAADCPYHLHFLDLFNSSKNIKNYSLIQNTYDCYQNYKKLFNKEQIVLCEDGDLDISFYPHAVLPNGSNIYPYITLNVSITSFIQLDHLFIQFKCLSAPDQSDKYCHDHSDQISRWNQMIWPCRELQLNENFSENRQFTNQTSIIRFSYNCFNLFGLSQYEVNVTVLPKNCRSVFYVTIPMHKQLEPKVRYFYDGKENKFDEKQISDLSPLVFVDMTLQDGVWIRFQYMSWILPPKLVTITIFERFDNEKTRFLMSERILSTENGFKWQNIRKGDYLIFVFVNRFDCKVSCASDIEDCKICAHTMLYFTLTKDKFSLAWRHKSVIINLLKALVIAIFVTLIFISIALTVVLLYLRVWQSYQLAHRPAENVELKESPIVLILYNDDCEAHSNVVLALANLLKESANAQVLFDQFAFQDLSIRPNIWLLNAISEAQFILIIFSECSKRILSGENLVQRRPFPDLFNTAIGYVIEKINEISSSESINVLNLNPKRFDLKKMLKLSENCNDQSLLLDNKKLEADLSRIIIARFSYSQHSVIPDFFARNTFGQLCLPQDLGLLIGRLHGVASSFSSFKSNNSAQNQIEYSADLEDLNAAINEFQIFNKNNLNWLEMRFENTTNKTEIEFINSPDLEKNTANFSTQKKRLNDRLESFPLQLDYSIPNIEEMNTKYGLEIPNLDDELNDKQREQFLQNTNNLLSQRFELYGKLEDFCESLSSSSLTSLQNCSNK